eukprot:scaffold8056_cov114-Isochrysis_galbana.AAC.4
MPPVGKSGPGSSCSSRSSDTSGSAMMACSASMSSPRLWGGMRVAIPTAMPEAPLSSSMGTRAGSTSGSSSEASKLSV